MKPKDLLKTSDLNRESLLALIDLAFEYKTNPHSSPRFFNQNSVVLYFNKPSTRTRISCETAIGRLGGIPLSVNAQELQLGRGETIEDTAHVISRYAKAFIIRTFNHDDAERFAKTATIPVINALTDLHHPLQSLADIMTIQEKFKTLKNIKVAYVGDGNNVTHSLMEACALMDIEIAVATPEKYQPNKNIIEKLGNKVFITDDPYVATQNAHVVYTDVWISMGTPEEERAERMKLLKPYQVNDKLMANASPDAIFMHCLPAHRGDEVSASVIDGDQSVVFTQAENRLHTVQAVLSYLC